MASLFQAEALDVALKRCKFYSRDKVFDCIDQICYALGLKDRLQGKTVLLKPNLISSKAPGLACTHPEFIAGAASWFLLQGARVRLGDSPAFGSAIKVCKIQGITSALKGLDVELIDFKTPVRKQLPCGIQVTVAGEALDCDLLVGLPRLKAHNQLYVTMAMKNLFGVVLGTRKAMLHMTKGGDSTQFSQMVVELASLFPRQVHLLDGIQVMNESGPIDGSPLDLGIIGGSLSPVALDSSLMHLLKLDFCRSPLLSAAQRAKMAPSFPENLHYPLNTPDHFGDSNFVGPATLNPIRFNPFRFFRSLLKRAMLLVQN